MIVAQHLNCQFKPLPHFVDSKGRVWYCWAHEKVGRRGLNNNRYQSDKPADIESRYRLHLPRSR